MSQSRVLFCVFLIVFFLPISLFARSAPVFVTVDWLAQHLSDPTLVVVDIRGAEQYNKGHVPGAVHAPFSSWAPENRGLSLEVPPDNILLDLIGRCGIKVDSTVVVVNRTDTDFSRADAMRVAWTFTIAGVKDACVLDGGYSKWLTTKQRTSTEITPLRPTRYDGKVDRSVIASRDYVLRKIGKSVIVDTRTPEDYFGISSKEGHVKSAVNLPAPWAYASDGSIKSEADLRAMAAGVIGKNKSKEVIVYCGVGGFASTWWLLLTQMLGYQNVKVYDGSMEEWIQSPGAPLATFSWH